jgi:polyhydroxyalkanoate synthesis regulator phasin
MILKEKFVKDFMDAHTIDKAITTGEIDIVSGTIVLKDLLTFVRKDIGTLDTDAKNKLEGAISDLDKKNRKRKEEIKNKYPVPEDAEEERILKYRMLKEDHIRYRQEIFYIQDLAYNKGWFD